MSLIGKIMLGLLVVVFVLGAAQEAFAYPVYVKPLTAGGNLQPNTLWTYNFTLGEGSSDCLPSDYSVVTEITTGNDGIGFVDLDVSNLTSIPEYFCEYRNGSLRLNKRFSDQFFNDIKGNISKFNRYESFEADDTYYRPAGGDHEFVVSDISVMNISSDRILVNEDVVPWVNNTYNLGAQNLIYASVYANTINGSESTALRIIGGDEGTSVEGDTNITGNVTISGNVSIDGYINISPSTPGQNVNFAVISGNNPALLLEHTGPINTLISHAIGSSGGQGFQQIFNTSNPNHASFYLWDIDPSGGSIYYTSLGAGIMSFYSDNWNLGHYLEPWRNLWVRYNISNTNDANVITVAQMEEAYNFSQNHTDTGGVSYNQSLNTTDNVTFAGVDVSLYGKPTIYGYLNVRDDYFGDTSQIAALGIELKTEGGIKVPMYFVMEDNGTTGAQNILLTQEGIVKYSKDSERSTTAYGGRYTIGPGAILQSLDGSRIGIGAKYVFAPPFIHNGSVSNTGLLISPGSYISFANGGDVEFIGIEIEASGQSRASSLGDWNRTGLLIPDFNDSNEWNESYSILSLGGLNEFGGEVRASKYVSERDGLGFSLSSSNGDLIMQTDVTGNDFFSLQTDGAFLSLYANPNPSVDYLMFTVSETQGADTEINFYEGGTNHNRLWSSGSVRIGGDANSDCTVMQGDHASHPCDTPNYGADLIVQGGIWAGNNLSTGNWTANITEIGDFETLGTVKVDNECGIPSAVFFAEESGSLNTGTSGGKQFSYGNGNVLGNGIGQPCSGVITTTGLICENDDAITTGTVQIMNNGTAVGATCQISTSDTSNQANFNKNCDLSFGVADVIGFITTTSDATANGCVPTMWVRYD